MVKTFTELKVWRESHKLSIEIYENTKKFPVDEIYGLTSQIRRASVSITSNIAEGFGRTTAKDRQRFYDIANGSMYELKSQLILAKDLGYISENQFNKIAEQANNSHKLLHGLLRSHKI
jgi:four helix bundle protein